MAQVLVRNLDDETVGNFRSSRPGLNEALARAGPARADVLWPDLRPKEKVALADQMRAMRRHLWHDRFGRPIREDRDDGDRDATPSVAVKWFVEEPGTAAA